MKEVGVSVALEDELDGITLLRKIERAGRTCYKSDGRITDGSFASFVEQIIKREHESVLEHEKVTLRIICDRGVSHEIVRHRIGSYSQESTRYCNYSDEKFSKEITVIKPLFWEEGSPKLESWRVAMRTAEKSYFDLLETGATPQEARSVLPNSLKTEIVVTYNLREWRYFLRLRTATTAHPQMREVANMCKEILQKNIPIVFDML